MIEVTKLAVELGGVPVLHDISFRLEQGRNLVILGRSGSGKTVLIKTLLGIITPESGEVSIDGTDVHHGNPEQRKELRKRFAIVFQNAALLDSFTVRQNVALPLYERGEIDCDLIQEKVINSLKTVGLEHTVNLYPSELSGGMRKRIGIARALVYQPDYIVFDEPISGLDPITAKEILYYIAQIADKAQANLITITHDIRNLENICDDVLFLDEGRLKYFGSLVDLQSSKDPFIRQYLE